MPRRKYAKAGPGYKYATRENLNTASKALSVAMQLKKLINVEYKTLNKNLVGDPSSTPQIINFTAIAQGDDIADRQGNKIRMKYLSVKGVVKLNASATRSNYRCLIVRDNNGSTTIPSVTDLFADASSFINLKHKKGDPQSNSRFSILWDKCVYLDRISRDSAILDFSMSLDHHCFFSGTSATDEGKGAIYIFQSSTEATNDPAVTADVQLKWIDN